MIEGGLYHARGGVSRSPGIQLDFVFINRVIKAFQVVYKMEVSIVHSSCTKLMQVAVGPTR